MEPSTGTWSALTRRPPARPREALVTRGELEADGARETRAPVEAVRSRERPSTSAPAPRRPRGRPTARPGPSSTARRRGRRRGARPRRTRRAVGRPRHRTRTLPRPAAGSLIIALPVAGRTWKDDLPSLILALAAQLGLVRAVDWARANTATHELARSLVENRFYFAPQIGSVARHLPLRAARRERAEPPRRRDRRLAAVLRDPPRPRPRAASSPPTSTSSLAAAAELTGIAPLQSRSPRPLGFLLLPPPRRARRRCGSRSTSPASLFCLFAIRLGKPARRRCPARARLRRPRRTGSAPATPT